MKIFYCYLCVIITLILFCACAVHYAADNSTFDGTLGTHSTIVTVPDSSHIINSNN